MEKQARRRSVSRRTLLSGTAGLLGGAALSPGAVLAQNSGPATTGAAPTSSYNPHYPDPAWLALRQEEIIEPELEIVDPIITCGTVPGTGFCSINYSLTWRAVTAMTASAAPLPIEETTIAALHAAYVSGRATAVSVCQAHLDRIAAYDRKGRALGAIIINNPDALADAAALDAALASTGKLVGQLHGVPVLVKDNYDVADLPACRSTPARHRGQPSCPRNRRRASLRRSSDTG